MSVYIYIAARLYYFFILKIRKQNKQSIAALQHYFFLKN